MLRVGVVGMGGISGVHMPVWQEMNDVQICAVCDIRPEQMQSYENVNHYTSCDEMLDNEELDILDVCLPTYLHTEYCIKALKRGINVLCEKPVSLKKEDINLLYKTARENKVCFMVAHVIRFWPEYVKIKEMYESGIYGKLLSGSVRRLSQKPLWSWDSWMSDEKKSGLVPFDLHIHDLDFLIYTFGAPNNVITHRAKRENQDYISATYEYDDFFVNGESSWFVGDTSFDCGCRFQFEKAIIEFKDGKLLAYQEDRQVVELMQTEAGSSGVINLPTTDAYANEIKYFADCVRENIFPEKIKPQELEEVFDVLKKFD